MGKSTIVLILYYIKNIIGCQTNSDNACYPHYNNSSSFLGIYISLFIILINHERPGIAIQDNVKFIKDTMES
jgi:hypothetical protein